MLKKPGVLLLGALVLATVLIGAAGAVNPPRPIAAPGIDLSNRAAVVKYLNSLGIDSKHVVIQSGARNYAGPSCPGLRWTCTTARQVVQIHGTNNQFECTASNAPGGSATAPNDCLIVQSSASTDNNATCTEKVGDPSGPQSCRIYQLNTSGANNATVRQQVAVGFGSIQYAEQSTEISQWNATGSNNAQVNQDLKESQSATVTTGAITQQQDGRQRAGVTQHSDSGNNMAQVNQSLQLKLSATGGSSITQSQDTLSGDYNQSGIIYQNADPNSVNFGPSSGTNTATLFQLNDLNAIGSKTPSLNQTQGNFNNGLFGDIDQLSTGISTSSTNQSEHQTLGASQIPAGGLSQTQYGPMLYDPEQGTNPGDTQNVSQSSDQNAGSGAFQSDRAEASCESSGTCNVHQVVTNNAGRGTNSCTDSFCDIGVTATTGGEGGGVFQCNGDGESGCPFPPFPDPTPPNICSVLFTAPPCSFID